MKNDKTLYGHMPYFITGDEKIRNELLARELDKWDHVRATEEMAKVPARFKTLTGGEMTDSTGLDLFIGMVHYLKSGEQFFLRIGAWEPTIVAAQKQVLHYHNTQYERTKASHGGNPGLPEKNSSNEGKESNLLHGRQATTQEVSE